MNYRLSHKQTENIQLTGITSVGVLSCALAFIFIKSLPLIWAVIGIALISSLSLYFSLNIYKAEFDMNFLYLSKRLNKIKISLKDVIEVKTFPVPIFLFYSNAYITSLRYIDGTKQKKAFVITQGSFSRAPTIDSIVEIYRLRQYIRAFKYGKTNPVK